MKSYASLAALKRRLGVTSSALDDDLALALVIASRGIDLVLGVDDEADDAWTGSADDLAVEPYPDAARVQATIYLAVRIHKSPDVPFGVAGMSDQGIVAYVRSIAPELDVILYGKRTSWGIA